MTEPLTESLERVAESPERATIRQLVERMKPDLVKSLQDDGAAERLMRHYLTAVRLNPQLHECTAESLLAALLLSAQVGLEPGPLGYVYLVPYKTECTWILGYTGILELARRSGRVAGLASEIVWDCDEYVPPWRDERGLHYLHRPGPVDERNERRGVLVTWQELAGSRKVAQAQDVPLSRIERAQKASRAFAKGAGPWVTDVDAMWRKTGVRAARPFLALTAEAAYAVAADYSRAIDVEATEEGAQPVLVEGEATDA